MVTRGESFVVVSSCMRPFAGAVQHALLLSMAVGWPVVRHGSNGSALSEDEWSPMTGCWEMVAEDRALGHDAIDV